MQRSEETMHRYVIDALIPVMIHAEDGEMQAIGSIWAEYLGFSHGELPTIMEWIETAFPLGFRAPIN